MSKGGGKQQTSTQNTSTVYPQWTQDAGQNAYNLANNMTNPFLQVPGYGVAGFNPDQTKAFDLARQMAMGAFTGSPTGVPGNPNPNAEQLGANDFKAFLNPYIDGVVNQAASKARGELAKTEADIGAKYAAAGAFGGGREALARGKAQDNFDENIQATTAQLLANGFDQATASAMANTQLRQQTANENRNYGLQAAQLQEAMRNGQTDRQASALQQLLGLGNQQQLFAQSALDLPWTNLQRLLGATPQVFNSQQTGTSTQPDNRPGAFQQILGAGASLLGMGTGGGGTVLGSLLNLSDRDEKTNIQKLGKDPDTGETLYAYDYKSDVKAAEKSGAPMPPKRVSAMAQDVEKERPGSTKRVGGKLVVKGR